VLIVATESLSNLKKCYPDHSKQMAVGKLKMMKNLLQTFG